MRSSGALQQLSANAERAGHISAYIGAGAATGRRGMEPGMPLSQRYDLSSNTEARCWASKLSVLQRKHPGLWYAEGDEPLAAVAARGAAQ